MVANAALRHSRAVQAPNGRRDSQIRPLNAGGLSQRDNPYHDNTRPVRD